MLGVFAGSRLTCSPRSRAASAPLGDSSGVARSRWSAYVSAVSVPRARLRWRGAQTGPSQAGPSNQANCKVLAFGSCVLSAVFGSARLTTVRAKLR